MKSSCCHFKLTRLLYFVESVTRLTSSAFSAEVIGEFLVRLNMTGAGGVYDTLNRRAEDVANELVNRRPLPRRPSTPPTPQPRFRSLDNSSCGTPPTTLDECPFFFEEMKIKLCKPTLERKKTIYDQSFMPEFDAKAKLAVMRHKNKILANKPSDRLSAFLKDVCQNESDYQALIQRRNVEVTDDYQTDAIYDIPRLNPATTTIPKVQVESTLYQIMDRIHKTQWRPFSQSRLNMCFVEICPFGMTQEDRCKFCLRLELLEHDQSMDWKIFAECVMNVSNDDLTLIDEFGARHAVPPVEIVLEHWYNLSQIDRRLCKETADLSSIIKVLKMKDRVQLIKEMGWEFY